MLTNPIKCKTWLWLALPFTLAMGCASGPTRTAVYSDSLTPAVAPLSESQTADRVVGLEIFESILADTRINYDLSASLDDGVVSLSGTSSDAVERQRVVDRMWKLPGVHQVKDGLGVDMAQTLPEQAAVAR